jgi:O-methyltransferase
MDLYLDLLKKVLIDLNRIDKGEYKPLSLYKLNNKQKLLLSIDRLLRIKNYTICKYIEPDIAKRLSGTDWPTNADTMIGLKRLENIQFCIEQVLANGIKGDLIETGVWRGGAVIFMRAVLKAYGVTDRTVWVADSFTGLPPPDSVKYSHDKGDEHHLQSILSVSLEDVKANFRKYDLLDEQVKFLVGWFKDTLPNAPIGNLAVLRLDGDMYESTFDALTNLFPKVSIGGYVIIDDWNAIKACKAAVEEFRDKNQIKDKITPIDQTGVYWKKTS